MPPVQQYVLNTPLTVALNLRYTDTNGIVVDTLYPNDYTELIGGAVSNLITLSQQTAVLLTNYNSRITALETSVAAIQSSGVTFMLYVNGGCLLGNTSVPITTAVTSLVASECAYITALGTPTALAQSVGILNNSALNLLPAFSQNSDMAGLANWKSTITTTADLEYNLALAYLDSRAGITKALAAVTPTCAQVIVDYQVVTNTPLTFVFYFSGYTFIPTGYTDSGSTIEITDTSGNIYLTGFNIVDASTTNVPVTLFTSGSTLSPTSTFYTTKITSKVTSSALGLTCEKVVIDTPGNPSYPDTGNNTCCPDIVSYSAVLSSGTTAITMTTSLSYIPRFASYIAKDGFTSGQLFVGGTLPYVSYTLGGAVLHFLPTSASGTFNIDFILYR